jgi:hypothetical protein
MIYQAKSLCSIAVEVLFLKEVYAERDGGT